MQENDEYRSLNQRISAAVERKSKAVLFGQLKQYVFLLSVATLVLASHSTIRTNIQQGQLQRV